MSLAELVGYVWAPIEKVVNPGARVMALVSAIMLFKPWKNALPYCSTWSPPYVETRMLLFHRYVAELPAYLMIMSLMKVWFQ